MIVLDYPKKTHDMSLIVPPFHTGHLGLIPGTRVTVGIMAPYVFDRTSCELVVSPFNQSTDDMALLTCTLSDDVGVVGKLVNAISDLDINIVTQESSALNHLKHHFVSLLLDLSTSHLRPSPTYESVMRHYTEYDSLFPVHDLRYVRIFESIIARCAEVIHWREFSGKSLPQLQIRPLLRRKFTREDEVSVLRDENTPYHVKIPLPDPIKSLLRQYLGSTGDQPLTYLLVSDADERVLRAFFPISAVSDKLIHLGFYHNDVPGALSALLRTLARARFNIVASLLRKQDTARSVWEAVLEYRGDKELPPHESGEELCNWVATSLIAVADNPLELERCNIDIGLPLYPRSRYRWSGRIGLNDRLRKKNARPLPREKIEDLLAQKSVAIANLKGDPAEKNRVSELVSMVRESSSVSATPTLFLSYSRSAERHAQLVRERLQDRYQIVEYMLPDGEAILDEVVRRILSCTYFIGIWNHDDRLPTEGGKYNISPWMPFEYGVAVAAKKHTIVIHSEKLDERVWQRINPGVSNLEYSDLYFTHTLDMLDEYCKKHMR